MKKELMKLLALPMSALFVLQTPLGVMAADSITENGLTTTVKGLTEENRDEVLNDFAQNIPECIEDGKSHRVENEALPDAEKYTTVEDEEGYDSYDDAMCWAAAVSDVLWVSGYAEEAVNPLTNENFKSEDEVFDYYRHTFTDRFGEPDGATEYFFEGTYKYAQGRGIANIKEDAPEGGLLKGETENLQEQTVDRVDTDNIFESLDLNGQSAEAGLSFWSKKDESIVGGHSVALMGMTKDQEAEDFTDAYKGVIIADSDNDAVVTSGPCVDKAEDRAEKAAQAPNSYTFYPVTWQKVGDSSTWVVEDYFKDNNDIITTLTNVYIIKDKVREDAQEVPHEESEHSGDTDTDTASFEENTDYTQELNVVYDQLRDWMEKNSAIILSPTGLEYISACMDEFGLYVRADRALLAGVLMDGNAVTEGPDGYYVEILPNGLFRIAFGKELMKSLQAGNHTLKLCFTDMEDVETVFVIR